MFVEKAFTSKSVPECHDKRKLITRQFKSREHTHTNLDEDHTHSTTRTKELQKKSIIPLVQLYITSILTNTMALRHNLVSFRIPSCLTPSNKRNGKSKTAEQPLLYSPERISQHQKEPAQRCVSDSTVCLLFGFLKVRSVEPLDVYKRKDLYHCSSAQDRRR